MNPIIMRDCYREKSKLEKHWSATHAL